MTSRVASSKHMMTIQSLGKCKIIWWALSKNLTFIRVSWDQLLTLLNAKSTTQVYSWLKRHQQVFKIFKTSVTRAKKTFFLLISLIPTSVSYKSKMRAWWPKNLPSTKVHLSRRYSRQSRTSRKVSKTFCHVAACQLNQLSTHKIYYSSLLSYSDADTTFTQNV